MISVFDAKVPRSIQRAIVADRKQPGRKHQHRPSQKAVQRKLTAAKVRAKKEIGLRRKLAKAISEYYRGVRDLYPDDNIQDIP